jgi:hypothetical protein
MQDYPDYVKPDLLKVRNLIIETAEGINGIMELEETLKWGEPSFLVKNGSTIRIDWKRKTPDQYAIYFKCTSKLVPTFRMVYGETFRFEDNRAIVLKIGEPIPKNELTQCLRAALTYHKVKRLPELGILR